MESFCRGNSVICSKTDETRPKRLKMFLKSYRKLTAFQFIFTYMVVCIAQHFFGKISSQLKQFKVTCVGHLVDMQHEKKRDQGQYFFMKNKLRLNANFQNCHQKSPFFGQFGLISLIIHDWDHSRWEPLEYRYIEGFFDGF